MSINRQEVIQKLSVKQSCIKFESDEDEGAAEYFSELQSVIDVLRNQSSTDQDIINAANHVGVSNELL